MVLRPCRAASARVCQLPLVRRISSAVPVAWLGCAAGARSVNVCQTVLTPCAGAVMVVKTRSATPPGSRLIKTGMRSTRRTITPVTTTVIRFIAHRRNSVCGFTRSSRPGGMDHIMIGVESGPRQVLNHFD